MATIRPAPDAELVGREAELALLRDAVHGGSEGTAILLTGEAGIGKTSLLQAVREMAGDGFRVLSTQGVRGTGSAGYEGLHALLAPVLSHRHNLPSRQRQALEVAFGITDGNPADRLITSIAAFGLLEDVAVLEPVLVLVEDLHWLDEPTAQVVGFLAARVRAARITLVATARADAVYPNWQPHFPEVVALGPLTDEEADELLRRRAPVLGRAERDVVLRQSRGNPLALTELAASPGTLEPTPFVGPSRVAMTRRLEQGFLAEVALLPEAAQRAALVAAAGEGSPYGEVLAAGAELGVGHDDFVVAERAGLLRQESDHYRLRHPLVGSALVESADSKALGEVHAALARATTDRTRAARHRAAAATGPDETVAGALEEVAVAAARRGARAEAATAWHRAAELSAAPRDRARRLVQAAALAREAGAPALSAELVATALPLVGDEEALVVDLARVNWLLAGTFGKVGLSVPDFLATASGLPRVCDRVQMLVWAAVTCYMGQEPSPKIRRDVAAALAATTTCPGSRESVYKQIGLQLTDPSPHIEDVDAAIAVLTGQADESDRMLLVSLALAAEDAGDLTASEKVWTAGAELSRRTSKLGDEIIFVAGRGSVRVTSSSALERGLTDSEQALRMSDDLGLPVVGALAAANIARARSWRGETELAQQALDASLALSRDSAISRLLASQHWSEGVIAAHEGRFDAAVDALLQTRVDPVIGLWAGGELAEPAIRAQRPEAVESWLATAAGAVEKNGAPHLAMLVDRSRAMLGPAGAARAHFESALRHGERSGANLEVARTRLYYGEWLRRERRLVEARAHLRAATQVFRSQSALALAERASRELRAAGGVDDRREGLRDATRELTGQELIVVRLAVQGLSNKEIADEIYLSHRTVQAHLHRAFVKLGINRRSQLAAALGDAA